MHVDQTVIEQSLKRLGIAYDVLEHPAVFTVEESTHHLSDKTAVKNLLLYEEKGSRVMLVIMAGLKRLDTKQLATRLEAKKLRFANEDMLMRHLRVTPGSVSLFNLYADESSGVEVVIDEALLGADELGFHPGVNTATIYIPSHALETILKDTRHTYDIIPL